MKNKIILLALGFAIVSCHNKKEVIQETTVEATAPKPETIAGKQCFLKVTENKADASNIMHDSLALSFETKGDSIYGTFKWLPSEKDKKTGPFKGTLTGTTANVILEAQAEGTTNKEELIFELADKQASVKFGEMTQGKDGIWHYKDVNTASAEVLQKTACK